VRSRLLSPAGKLRFALDYALPPRRENGDETLATFVRRRLGGEVYDRLIEPLMGGIYAGDGAELSLAATFPHLREGELRHGGLIRGVLAAKATAPVSRPEERRWPPFVAPESGMVELVEALEGRLRDADVRILTETTVDSLARHGKAVGSRSILSCADGTLLPADAVILATPAFVAADLVAPLDRQAADHLGQIPHVSTATVAVAYPLSAFPRRLDGYGYVVPRAEGQRVLACTWTSSKWEHRAPAGFGLVRAFVGRAGDEAVTELADDELLTMVRTELRNTLGVDAAPVFHRVFRWARAMPQPILGHLDRVAAIDARVATLPGLFLAGNAYRGIGIPDCIRSGETAATHAAAYIADRAQIAVVA
jgi:oxygen-dependent protoporphyrinogen oxidase